MVAKKNFSLENGVSLSKATLYIPKKKENLSWSVYKSSNFGWFLQTVALKWLFGKTGQDQHVQNWALLPDYWRTFLKNSDVNKVV